MCTGLLNILFGTVVVSFWVLPFGSLDSSSQSQNYLSLDQNIEQGKSNTTNWLLLSNFDFSSSHLACSHLVCFHLACSHLVKMRYAADLMIWIFELKRTN